MPVSESQQTGSVAESDVEANFKRINWNPVRNSSLEIGTDYLIEARDDRRHSRGLIIGAQVKGGPSYFERPSNETDGTEPGWWYCERDKDHFDDWVTHCLPHLVVLHNDRTRTSYWVHVTAAAVVSTGKGCKILVPKSQTVDKEHADDLFDVACQQKAAQSIDGTAFRGVLKDISPARHLRHALIAPRVIAPDLGSEADQPIDAVQAVALLAQGRRIELASISRLRAVESDVALLEQYRRLELGGLVEEYSCVPDPRSSHPSRDWTWRFVAAIWDWSITGSVEELKNAYNNAYKLARSKEAAAASGVLLACALQRLEKHEAALKVLNNLIDKNDLLPVDHGWVLVQRARIRFEIGDIAGAGSDAISAQRSLTGDNDDITASSLASTAASLLFTAAYYKDFDEWMDRRKEARTASDTAVSWWQSGIISSSLQKVARQQFESWAEDRTYKVTMGGSLDVNDLFEAEFTADITGKHSNWRSISSLAARQQLMRVVDSSIQASENEISDLLVKGLDALRRSGDSQMLKLALERFHRDGPLEAVFTFVNEIPMIHEWTHTTATCNFKALAIAGDLLTEESASMLAIQCAQLMNGGISDFIERTRPRFNVLHYAFPAIVGLLRAVDDNASNEIAAQIASEYDKFSGAIGVEKVIAVVRSLDFDRITAPVREALWNRGQQDHGWLGAAVLGLLASNGHPRARTEVISRAVGGDLHALAAMTRNDISALEGTDAASIIAQLEDKVQQRVREASHTCFAPDLYDKALILTLLNLSFPQEARWAAVLELLCNPCVTSHDKRPTGLLIAEHSAELPAEVQQTLAENIDNIRHTSFMDPGLPFRIGSISTLLRIALGILTGDDADVAAVALAYSDVQERQDIAKLLGMGRCPSLQPLLAALTADPHPDVRYQAGIAIGRILSTNPTKPIHALAWELAKRDGVWLPAAILQGLAYNDRPLTGAEKKIAQYLQTHPSALVRNSASRLLR